MGRLLRRGEDGRWRWRHDPLAISGPTERRIDLSRDGPRIQSELRSRRGATLLVRTGGSSLLEEAEGARLSVDIPNLEYVDLSRPGRGSKVAEAIMPAVNKFLDSCAPRSPQRDTIAGIDPAMLRKAFGCFATGVTILTTIAKDGRPVGLTANSFCSESLKHQAIDGGDHRIFIGMVRHVWFDPSKNSLLFFQGKYRSVHVAQ